MCTTGVLIFEATLYYPGRMRLDETRLDVGLHLNQFSNTDVENILNKYLLNSWLALIEPVRSGE